MIRPKGIISQYFGENKNNSYKKNGLKGHTGIDWVYRFKSPLYAIADGYVYKVLNKNNPDLNKYRCVNVISETPIGLAEISYGHLWDIWVEKGDKVKEGQPIGTEGNTGIYVYQGGRQVKASEKPTGAGHHIHLQFRPIIRTNVVKSGEHYLRLPDGTPYHDGESYFKIVLKDNGYRGCMDYLYMLNQPTLKDWIKIYTKVIFNISKTLKK